MLISRAFASGTMEFAKPLYAIMNSNQKAAADYDYRLSKMAP